MAADVLRDTEHVHLRTAAAEQAPTRLSVRFALRESTAEAHHRVDRLYSTFDLESASGYRAFLQAQAVAFLATEQALEIAGVGAFVADWPARRRTAALLQDLAELGSAMPPAAPALSFAGEAQILGALYVLEGSRLGGSILVKRVKSGLPTAFLAPADAGHWRSFVGILEDRLSSDRLADAKLAALAVFATFEGAAQRQLA